MTDNLFFPAGTVIFKERSWELAMYDIRSGRVGIYANYGTDAESLLTELEAGKYFGEMAVIDGMPRTATAVALEDTETVRIDSTDFEAYLSENPEKVIDIFRKLSSRLRELTDSYMDACLTVKEYVEDNEEEKPEGLMAKIRKLLTFSEDYSEVMSGAFDDMFRYEEMNHFWYY